MRSEAWRLLAAAAVALLSWPVTAVDTGSRPLPTFVSLRHPQSFAGTLPASADPQKPNGTAKVSLHLYSVVPDAADRQVHLLFEYQGGEMKHLRQTLFPKEKCNEDVTGQRCSDLLPHLREPSFGDLRCEFISPDGRVMAAAPVPVIAREADLRPATTFVGTCAMPPKFYQLVAQDDYDGPPPQVRLLREGDAGAGAHVFAAVGPGAWQGDNGRSCSRLLATEHGNASPEACRDVCHHAHAQAENNSGGLTDCTIWQWSDNQCRTGGRSKFNNKCKANDQWVGGQLRREAWDAVDTARPNNKRLIAFGCSMPLFGDGTYMNRVPQWIECVDCPWHGARWATGA